jgi:hypothetical protein
VIHLQPRDGLQLHLLAQGQENRRNGQMLAPVHLDLDFDKRFGSERRRRLRAPAAGRDRRTAEPVRAQRRTGGGLALGGTHAWSTGPATSAGPPALRGRHLGTRVHRAAMIARDGLLLAGGGCAEAPARPHQGLHAFAGARRSSGRPTRARRSRAPSPTCR